MDRQIKEKIMCEIRKRLSVPFEWMVSELEALLDTAGGDECKGTFNIGFNPKYGDGYSACIIHGPLRAAPEGIAIPPPYHAIVDQFNGAKFFAIDLFGVLDDESNHRRCLSLLSANAYWIHGYNHLPKGAFHFGGRFYSQGENVGYFYDLSQWVFSAKKSGEIVGTWPSIDAMLRDESQASQKIESEVRERLSRIRSKRK